MVNSVNSAQQAYLNPFQQKDSNQVQGQQGKEAEAGKAQSKETEGAGSVVSASASKSESRQDLARTSESREPDTSRPQSRERGSLVDISV